MAAQTEEDRSTGSIVDVDRLSFLLLLATVALLPLVSGLVLWSAEGGADDFNQRVSVSPFDVPLLLLVVLAVADCAERRRNAIDPRRWPSVTKAVAVALAWLVVAALVHPSWRALDFAFHLAGAWAIVWTVRRLDDARRTWFLAAVLVLSAQQAALGIAQAARGEPLGLGLIEWHFGLYEFGGSHAGRGSFSHPYHLAILLMVGVAAAAIIVERLERKWMRQASWVAATVVGTAITLTFSRAALLALAPMVVILLVRRGLARGVAVAVIAGLLIGGTFGSEGVESKAVQTATPAATDTGRRTRLEEARALIEAEPIFGVGPGRYVIALRDVEHTSLLPAHNIVAHAAAESGVVGGALVLAALAAFGLWALRRGAMAVTAGLALAPFLLLDAFPYVFPMGLVVSGLWIATVRIAADHQAARA